MIMGAEKTADDNIPGSSLKQAAVSLPLWARAVLFALSYFIACEIETLFSTQPGGIMAFRFAGGIAVAVFISSERRIWWALVLGLCVARLSGNLLHNRAVMVSFLLCLADLIEPIAGAMLFQRFLGRRAGLQSVKELVGLLILPAAAAPAIGATFLSAASMLFAGNGNILEQWLHWWAAGVLGVILFAPACLLWKSEKLREAEGAGTPRAVEAVLLTLAAIVCTALVFGEGTRFPSSHGYLIMPLFLWAALRFELHGTAAVGAAISLTAAWRVTFAESPAAATGDSISHIVASLQIFLGISHCTALFLAAILAERTRAELETLGYADRLRTLYEIAQAIISTRSPESIAKVALIHMRKLVPCKEASITEFDMQTRHARVLAVEGDEEPRAGAGSIMPVDAFGIEDLKLGAIHRINNIQLLAEKDTILQTMLAENVNSLLRIPLLVREELIGSLNMGSDRAHAFKPDHIEAANEIAVLIALAMRHARLHQQTIQDADTKAMLLKEVNHRVKNNLSAIIGLLYTELNRHGTDSTRSYSTLTRDLINRIQGLATAHDMLSATQWRPLRLSELAEQIIHTNLRTTLPGKNVQVDVPQSTVRVMPDQAHNLALIVNELATNSMKYALPGRDNGRIAVRITQADHTIRFEFRDDGPGYPEPLLKNMRQNLSIGFDIIQNIVQKALRGRLILHNDHGAVTVVEFESPI